MTDRDRARSGWAGGLLDHLRDGLRGYLDVLGDEPEAPGADLTSDRLDPPTAAEPYQPRRKNADTPEPQQRQTTTSEGTTMASIEEVKAGIGQATDTASNSLGYLQQAHSELEQASGTLQQATQGSSQADASEATGLFQRAIELITEVQQTVSMAIKSAEGVAARL